MKFMVCSKKTNTAAKLFSAFFLVVVGVFVLGGHAKAVIEQASAFCVGSITGIGNNAATVNWPAPNIGTQYQYDVQVSTSATFTSIAVDSGWVTNSAARSYNFTTLVAGTKYYYRLSLVLQAADSTYTNALDFATNDTTPFFTTTGTAPAYTVGGNITGSWASGDSVTLQDNGGDNLTITNPTTAFTFATSVTQGQPYAVTVLTQPTGKTCTVTGGSGTMGSANVTNVSVSCALKTFVVTPSLGTGGTAVSPATATVSWGGSQTFTTTNTSGYSISGVAFTSGASGDGTSGAEVATVVDTTHFTISNVTATTAVTVTFVTAPTYTITTSPGSNVTISCSPSSVLVGSPANSYCTISPASNYYVSSVTVDGVAIGGGAISNTNVSYTFYSVTANHTIAATSALLSTVLTQSTYTSNPIALNSSLGFNTINWAPSLPGGAANIMAMRVRSCSTVGCADLTKGWAQCGLIPNTTGNISISGTPTLANGTNCLTPGDPYVQYQVVMGTTDSTSKTVPTFGPVSITNNSGYSQAWQALVSSPFNTGNVATAVSNLAWTLGAGSNTNVKFQLRTAPDDGTGQPNWAAGSGWCGSGTSACSQAMADGTYGPINTVALGSTAGPRGVAFDTVTNSIWVTNQGTNTVSQINPSTRAVINTVSVGLAPIGISFDSVTNSVWVANANSNTVSRINPSTHSVVSTINVGNTPIGISFDSVTNSVWVANAVGNTVSQINPSTNTVINTVTGLSSPIAVGFDTVTNSIWVANQQSSGTVSQINPSTHTVINTVTGLSYPSAIAFDTVTNSIWIANNNGTASQINPSTHTVINTVTVGSVSNGIVFDNVTNSIWVANQGSNTVSQINPSTHTVINTVTIGSNPMGVAFDGFTKSIWVANNNVGTVSQLGVIGSGYYTTNSGNTINSTQTTRTGNQWVQYALFMQSTNGTSSPTPVTNVTTQLSFNSPPTISTPTVAQVTSGADASKVKATYNLSDVDVGSSDAPSTSDYQMLLYQPDTITLQSAITDTTGTGNILLNNSNSRPVPTSGYIMIDSELIKYTGASTASGTTTLSGIVRSRPFDDVTSGSSYPTIGATHTASTAVFFRTSVAKTTFSSGAAINSAVTTTPTQYSITWDAANEPNMSSAFSGASVPPWTNWNFKVAAADGNYGTDAGTSTASTLTTLDLQPPTLSSVTPAAGAYFNSTTAANGGSKVSFTNSETLQSGSIKFTYLSGTNADSNSPHVCAFASPLLTSGAHSAVVLNGTNCTAAQTALVDGDAYTIAIDATDLYGNTMSTISQTVNYDTTAPVINSVSAANPNKSYSLGAKIPIQLNMSEPVSNTNSVVIKLQAGSNTPTCTISPIAVGSETQYPTCTYTVGSGDDTTNLYAISPLTNQTTFLDRAGNALTTQFTFGSTSTNLSQSNVIIDTKSQEKISGQVGFNGSVTGQEKLFPPGTTGCTVGAGDKCIGSVCTAGSPNKCLVQLNGACSSDSVCANGSCYAGKCQ